MVFFNTVFIQNNIVFIWIDSFYVLQTFQNYWVESSTQSGLVIQSYCSIDYSILYQEVSWFFTNYSSSVTYFLISTEDFMTSEWSYSLLSVLLFLLSSWSFIYEDWGHRNSTMFMKNGLCLAQVSVHKEITWWNQCVQNMIRVDKV